MGVTTTDVLQATVGYAPSYAWRSFHQAIWILNKGCCMKVGNGASIDIWKDQWLHNQNGFRVLTHNPRVDNVERVQDLIIDNPQRWNKDLIEHIFLPFEGTIIQQIPLTFSKSQDSIMWMHNESGEYSVKTGYFAQQVWKTQQDQGTSNNNVMDTTWKKIWSLDTIPRHRVLLWRIINKALPVREELHKRGINCSLLCPRCEEGIETIDHLFLNCDCSRRELFGSNLGINFQSNTTADFVNWLISFIYTNDKPPIINLDALLYSIWHARNQKVFEDKTIPEDVVIQRACNNISSFRKARSGPPDHHHRYNQIHPALRSTRAPEHTKWVKPQQGVIKLNTDANLSVPDVWGIGFIARNDADEVEACGTWHRPGFMCPLTAEAWGVYQAVLFALESGFQQVLFENDNEKLISILTRKDEDHRTYLRTLTQSIVSLSSRFSICGFSHVKREGNSVAHCLAHLAAATLNQVWVEDVPAQAQSLYLSDLFS